METILKQLHDGKDLTQPVLLLGVLFLLVFTIVVIGIVMIQIGALYNIFSQQQGGRTWQEDIMIWWNDTYNKQAGLQPLAVETDLLLNHDYDGIKELDNHLPPWWVNLFYTTIVFGIVYMVMYHVVGSWQLQAAEFDTEMATAKVEKDAWEKTQVNSISETTAKYLTDANTLAEGAAIFTKNCVACHAADGGGGVGPNLTDQYWIHGNKIGEVFKTIKYGVAGKGMTAWQATLNPKEIQAVSSYVLSLNGKPVAQPKAPQGELIGVESKTVGTDSTASDTTKVSTVQDSALVK